MELINRIDEHLFYMQDEIKFYCEIPERQPEFNIHSSLTEWDFDELIWLFRALRSMIENG
mgnify:CR=1 FL=1